MTIPALKLTSGDSLPSIGLGLWKIDPETVSGVVLQAAQLGYRHFDSASDYGNEVEAGAGIRRILDKNVCRRDELWITSKLWNTDHAREHVRSAALRSLADLGLDYLDLYLVHFPIALEYVSPENRYPAGWVDDPDATSPSMSPTVVPFQETWQAMEQLVDDGLVRNIGVCNVGCTLLRDVLSYATIRPAVLQVELHPYLTQEKLLRFCQQEKIAVAGFSPLGALSYVSIGMADKNESVLDQPCVQQAAARHQKTAAQIVLRWAVQRGTAILPKSSHPGRLAENLALFDFELSDGEMTAINDLNANRRYNDPGDFCEKSFGTFFPIYE